MIINFRYHIFTITAIFAALGLGILIGSSIIGQDGLINEQEKIINNIAASIRQLGMENTELKSELDILKEKLEYHRGLEMKLLPLIVEDRLSDREYFLVYLPEDDATVDVLEDDVNDRPGELLNKIGLKTKVITGVEKISEELRGAGVILWNLDEDKRKNFEELNGQLSKLLIYNGSDIGGLILKLLQIQGSQ